jgi:hypothetical protein
MVGKRLGAMNCGVCSGLMAEFATCTWLKVQVRRDD